MHVLIAPGVLLESATAGEAIRDSIDGHIALL
jgi:hypothetical protein